MGVFWIHCQPYYAGFFLEQAAGPRPSCAFYSTSVHTPKPPKPVPVLNRTQPHSIIHWRTTACLRSHAQRENGAFIVYLRMQSARVIQCCFQQPGHAQIAIVGFGCSPKSNWRRFWGFNAMYNPLLFFMLPWIARASRILPFDFGRCGPLLRARLAGVDATFSAIYPLPSCRTCTVDNNIILAFQLWSKKLLTHCTHGGLKYRLKEPQHVSRVYIGF